MALTLKTLQWNIGGGKIRVPGGHDYNQNGLPHIIETIIRLQPDIVTLQEVHTGAGGMQAAQIAAATGLPHFINDPYSPSHVEEGQQLSLATLSRFALDEADFNFLPNPKVRYQPPSGAEWVSFDKGVSRCVAQMPSGPEIEVFNVHAVPFFRFKADALAPEFAHVRTRMEQLVAPRLPMTLLQGDFNNCAPTLAGYLPNISRIMTEPLLAMPTTPAGHNNDHVLYKGVQLQTLEVLTDVLTDHYALLANYSL